MSDDLRYPVGEWVPPGDLSPAQRAALIDELAALPAQLRAATATLSDHQLDTPYRPGGWTLRQLVHHVADSHVNGYVRAKLALTEATPTIKPYEEARWAELPDSTGPIEVSLRILESVHERWVALLRALPAEAFTRTYHHPDSGRQSLDASLSNYAWHGRHHLAHLTRLKARSGW
jgi:uncharacterized damage-inducible protein DinB